MEFNYKSVDIKNILSGDNQSAYIYLKDILLHIYFFVIGYTLR